MGGARRANGVSAPVGGISSGLSDVDLHRILEGAVGPHRVGDAEGRSLHVKVVFAGRDIGDLRERAPVGEAADVFVGAGVHGVDRVEDGAVVGDDFHVGVDVARGSAGVA